MCTLLVCNANYSLNTKVYLAIWYPLQSCWSADYLFTASPFCDMSVSVLGHGNISIQHKSQTLYSLSASSGTTVSVYDRQKAVAAEKASENGSKKSRLDLQSLPTRQYLDQTVVPALQQALSVLSKERSVGNPGTPSRLLQQDPVWFPGQLRCSWNWVLWWRHCRPASLALAWSWRNACPRFGERKSHGVAALYSIAETG